jgi:hypothetical protein
MGQGDRRREAPTQAVNKNKGRAGAILTHPPPGVTADFRVSPFEGVHPVYHEANEIPRKTVPLPEAAGRLFDALTEFDAEDPALGPPEQWPEWTDDIRVRLGKARFPQERFDDLPGDENEIPF